MTIALCIKTNDGVVLAADSATSLLTVEGKAIQVYNNANKIVNLCKGEPFGIATYGLGNIGPHSIALLAKEFRAGLLQSGHGETTEVFDPSGYQLWSVADRFCEFINKQFVAEFAESEAHERPILGFILAGYSTDQRLPEVYIIETVNGELAVAQQEEAVIAKGQPESVQRLIYGFDFEVVDSLVGTLGLEGDERETFLRIVFSKAEGMVHPAMPLQDAIDLAKFLVENAIQYQRFRFGDKTVGGPVEIATMTKYEGFKWVLRKHYYDSALNPR